MKIVNAGVQKKEVEVGFALKVEAEVNLGQLKPDDVQVQVLSGPLDSDYNLVEPDSEVMECTGQVHDSLVADVPEHELDAFLEIAQRVTAVELRRAWTWITVPLAVEVEVSPPGTSWADKKEVKLHAA